VAICLKSVFRLPFTVYRAKPGWAKRFDKLFSIFLQAARNLFTVYRFPFSVPSLVGPNGSISSLAFFFKQQETRLPFTVQRHATPNS
jgi:hypothetical protein